jgi:DNA-binding LacI/PurR family transcriptional regulator
MAVRHRVTIKQVAKQAGVSTQTVSRVINGRPDVAAETRDRVSAVITRLGYQPNDLARSLIRRRSHTLGVVTAGLTYTGPACTLSGITDQAEAMGYSLLLKVLRRFDTDDVEPILNALLARQVDGIIWAVAEVNHNHEWVDGRLPDLPVPIIFLTMHHQAGLSVVAVDNYLGGRIATEHLLEQGYRRIGHISGPLAWWEARQRQAGWHDAVADAGIPVSERHWTEGDWSSKSGEVAIQQLLDRFPGMEAVFVANDQMAISVLLAACRAGLKIPQDLAVVGFDGIPEAAYLWPPLTTVHQDLYALGHTAVQRVARLIEASQQPEGDVQPEMVWLTPQLIVRESSCRSARSASVLSRAIEER